MNRWKVVTQIQQCWGPMVSRIKALASVGMVIVTQRNGFASIQANFDCERDARYAASRIESGVPESFCFVSSFDASRRLTTRP